MSSVFHLIHRPMLTSVLLPLKEILTMCSQDLPLTPYNLENVLTNPLSPHPESEPMVSPPTYIHASAAFSSWFFTGDAEALYDDLVKFHSNQLLDEKTYKHFKVYRFLGQEECCVSLLFPVRTMKTSLGNSTLTYPPMLLNFLLLIFIGSTFVAEYVDSPFLPLRNYSLPTYNDSLDSYPLGFRANLDINALTSTLMGNRVLKGQCGARLNASDSTAHYFTLFIHDTHNLFHVRHDATVLPEDYLFLYAIEVFTMPLDVVVEAHVRTIRSTILKDSSTHILDLPISTDLSEPVVYPVEALIFSPYPSLPPPTSLSATVGTSAHHGASSSSAPTLVTDDQYAKLSYLYLDYLEQVDTLHDIFVSVGQPTLARP
ncbi:hypothetical protein Syun_027165 [Stephania yunnanensis]|uniref:Uncharacterized protein n=1 Tax=Stephania yunnanensis TaxID=152371 RepID=A0AAP0EFG9_9MAGN